MKHKLKQELQIREIGYDDPALAPMIGRLDRLQIALYGIERCNLDPLELLQASGAYLAGAYINDLLIGMGAIKLFEGYAEIKRMFVEPAFRGQDIAGNILATLEAYSKSRGKNTACLETGKLQPAAIAFYKKCGYDIVERFGSYGPNPVSVYFQKGL